MFKRFISSFSTFYGAYPLQMLAVRMTIIVLLVVAVKSLADVMPIHVLRLASHDVFHLLGPLLLADRGPSNRKVV